MKNFVIIIIIKIVNIACPELKSNTLSLLIEEVVEFYKKYDTTVAVVSNNKLKDYIFDMEASKEDLKLCYKEVKKLLKI